MIHILTAEQSRILKETLYLDPRPPSIAALLMLQCGLRTYEATQVTTAHLFPSSFDARSVYIPPENAKRSQTREVPIPQELSALIRYRIHADNTEIPGTIREKLPLSPGRSGRPISTRWLEAWLKTKTQLLLGMPIRPYTLRHTFATKVRKHADLPTLMKILGHKNLKSTQAYMHPTFADAAAAMEAANVAD